MTILAEGMDIVFDKGAGESAIVDAIHRATGIDARAIVRYDNPMYFEAVKYGKWAYIHDLPLASRFSYKVDVEINELTDFELMIRSMQNHIKVNIAIPDPDSPLDDDMILFEIDGNKVKINVPQEEFN